ncbi:MerR family transcriptional regulator [Azospirillum isscasi]|uniref:MerR family transcriptional regulator n=1 Tax=Azospirillum isscasi TaxID=3053926 RepID=A0ABU0WDT5_9PROT|nr:MerR family transcriptional regulator [Azospirillum isscasi]MDQ2101229.1 MerR family transcriptional regulator [Azospirillum isscasi]
MKARGIAKSATAFRTISEVSSELDVPQHVLRFWEGKFPQLRPLKRGGGRRYYRPEDVELLRQIQSLLYGEGYTIKGVQRLLKDGQVDGDPENRRGSLGLDEPDALETPLEGPPDAADADPDEAEEVSDAASETMPSAVRQAIAQALDELKEARLLLANGEGK